MVRGIARDSPEPNNLLKDCLELERFRLQIAEPQLMVENSKILAEKVDNVISALFVTNSALFVTNLALFVTNEKLSQLVDLLTPKEHSTAKSKVQRLREHKQWQESETISRLFYN